MRAAATLAKRQFGVSMLQKPGVRAWVPLLRIAVRRLLVLDHLPRLRLQLE